MRLTMRLLMAGVCIFTVANARADGDFVGAREHYRKATKAYELGLYEEAIREYTDAYKLKDDPAILYNLAQAHRFAEHPAEALRLYRMYLIKVSDAPNRSEVEAKIDALQKVLEVQKRSREIPPEQTVRETQTPPTTKPTREEPTPIQAVVAPSVVPSSYTIDSKFGRTKRIAGLAVGLVGIGLAAAGTGLGVAAKNTSDELTKSASAGQHFDSSKYQTGQNENVAASTLLAVGGAAVVVGIVVAALGFRERRVARVKAAVWLAPTVTAASLEGHF